MEGLSGYESTGVGMRLRKRIFNVGEYLLYTDSLVYDPSNPLGYRDNVSLLIRDESGNKVFDSFGVPNPNSGRINILRLDTINYIIAGTFYFDAVNKEGDTIKVTDGRFDLKYAN